LKFKPIFYFKFQSMLMQLGCDDDYFHSCNMKITSKYWNWFKLNHMTLWSIFIFPSSSSFVKWISQVKLYFVASCFQIFIEIFSNTTQKTYFVLFIDQFYLFKILTLNNLFQYNVKFTQFYEHWLWIIMFQLYDRI